MQCRCRAPIQLNLDSLQLFVSLCLYAIRVHAHISLYARKPSADPSPPLLAQHSQRLQIMSHLKHTRAILCCAHDVRRFSGKRRISRLCALCLSDTHSVHAYMYNMYWVRCAQSWPNMVIYISTLCVVVVVVVLCRICDEYVSYVVYVYVIDGKV